MGCLAVLPNEQKGDFVNVRMNLSVSYPTLSSVALALLILVACQATDTTKIIQPTDYQISTVSLALPREVIATNMAAQSVSDDEAYTLVGAALRKGEQTLVGLWLFSEEDSSFVKSVNQEAVDNSPFPAWQQEALTQEADNLVAFLTR